MISGFTTAVPFTKNDENLFTDLVKEEQETVKAWIQKNLWLRETPNYHHTSYGIKHILQHDTGIYLTNNQFKHAMAVCGFYPVNAWALNWNYCLSQASPAFKK